jgi:polysaccharide export outer membrane protein
MESAELRGDIEVLRVELLRAEVRRQRLEAELANAATFEPRPIDIPLPLALVQGIMRTEVQHFEARRSDYQAQLSHLHRLQEQTNAKLEVLVEQLRREDEGTRVDQEEADRLRDLVQRGVASTNRAVETRRNSLLSATRALQTRVEVEQARKEREEIGRRIDQLAAQRRDDVLREIQEGNVQLAVLHARHGSVGEKIFYSGVLRSQLVRGRGGRPEITIVRRIAEGRSRITANENSELVPGDVVEVTLRLEHLEASEPSPASGAPSR